MCTCWGGGDFGTVASLSFSFNQCAAGCGRFTRRLNLCCGMIQKTWQEIEFRMDVSRATDGVRIETY